MFGRARGVHLEGSDTVTQPLMSLPAFAKVVRAITRNVAQVPFVVGEWKTVTDRSTREKFWKEGFGRTFKIAHPLEGMKRQASKEVWVESTDSPLAKLFFNPNPHLSRFQLFEGAETWLLHDGEAFFYFNGVEKEGDVPEGIELLAPAAMRPVPQVGMPEHWVYTAPGTGQQTVIELYEMAHVKYFNPYHPIRGLSPRESCGMAIHMLWDAWRFNRSLLRNGGWPGGMIIAKAGMDDDTKKQMRHWLEEETGGPQKAGRWIPVEGDVEFKPIEYHFNKMQFLQLIKQAETDLRGVYKVPESEISEYENKSYASSLVGKRSFWEATIIPDLRLDEDVLWNTLFSKIDNGRWEGRFDLTAVPALGENLTEKLDQAKKLFDMGHAGNDINARLELGMPRKDWMDTGYRLQNLVPVDTPVFLGPGALGAPGNGKTLPAPPPPDQIIDAKFEVRDEKKIEDLVWKIYWDAWNKKVFRPGERKFEGIMRRYFMALRAAQLDRFDKYISENKGISMQGRRLDDVKIRITLNADDIEAILFNRKVWEEEIATRTEPGYQFTIGESIKNRIDEIGVDATFSLTDPAVIEFMRAKEIKLANEANGTLAKGLRAQLIEGSKNNESVSQLAARIRDEFNLATGRASLIARTETLQSSGWAQWETDNRTGVVVGKLWVHSGDAPDPGRQEHADFQSLGYVEMDFEYDRGLLYPGDPNAAGEQLFNCRCTYIPQVGEESFDQSMARTYRWSKKILEQAA